MAELRLFTDGSVNPQSKVGYGAYLLVTEEVTNLESLQSSVKSMRFEQTSSTKLELQTLLWALSDLTSAGCRVIIHTDSQNILSLQGRRARFEQNDYKSKKNRYIANHELYREFYKVTDLIECEIVKVRGHPLPHQKEEVDRLFALVDRASRNALRENSC
ncbi:MAG: ribonuclease H [Helicobacteraceae bacterium]|jgi:ribonuclease HI|nr:ribonuclease H [Helicobacteraceae bacterium]